MPTRRIGESYGHFDDGDRVAVGDPGAFVLGGKNNDRKYYDGNDEGRDFNEFWCPSGCLPSFITDDSTDG